MKYYQNGGLLLTKKYNSTFEAVYEMIMESSDIEIVYMESLKGFIFKLVIDKDKSKFTTLNEYKTDINDKVDSLILKFAIISNNLKDLAPPLKYQGYELNKQTEIESDVINEVFIQQHIYLESIKNTGNPISPGLADYSYFNTEQSFIILDFLIAKAKKDEAKKVFKYLKEQIALNHNSGYYLSLITMENAQSYEQLHDVWVSTNFSLTLRRETCCIAIAQLLRLFLQFGIVHCDCHGGNILVKKKDPEFVLETLDMLEVDVKIIDYGRYINIYDEINNDNSKISETQKKNIKLIFYEKPGINIVKKLLEIYKKYIIETNEEKKNKLKDILINLVKSYIYRILLTDLYYNIGNFRHYGIQCSFIFKALKLVNITDEGTPNIKIQFYEMTEFNKTKYIEIIEKLYFLIETTQNNNFTTNNIEKLKNEKRFAEINTNNSEIHSRNLVNILKNEEYNKIPSKKKFTFRNPFRRKGGKNKTRRNKKN
jgi:hypothetical protein